MPAGEAQTKAVDLLKNWLPAAERVERIVTTSIEFIDQGENFEGVFCAACGEQLDDEDWGDAMDAASASDFASLDFVTPCCNKRTTLNDLNYQWPAGFARFRIEAWNPDVARPLDNDRQAQLEQVLSTPLRQIWARI